MGELVEIRANAATRRSMAGGERTLLPEVPEPVARADIGSARWSGPTYPKRANGRGPRDGWPVLGLTHIAAPLRWLGEDCRQSGRAFEPSSRATPSPGPLCARGRRRARRENASSSKRHRAGLHSAIVQNGERTCGDPKTTGPTRAASVKMRPPDHEKRSCPVSCCGIRGGPPGPFCSAQLPPSTSITYDFGPPGSY